MVYDVRVFYDTGFNPDNIPYSADIITDNFTSTSKVFESVFELQNKGLGQIKIKASWEDIDGADYVMLAKPGVNVWYFVTDITMSNENVAILSLSLDALTTLGLNNLTDANIIDGLSTVIHHDDYKKLFHNNFPQSRWSVGNPLVIKGFQVIGENTEYSNQHLIGSTVNLNAEYTQAKVWYADETTKDNYLLTPKIPQFAADLSSTFIGLNTESINYRKKVEGYTIYSLPGNIGLNQLQQLFEIGLSDCICCSYSIPENYIKSIKYSEGFVTELVGGVTKEQVSTLPYKYQNDIVNAIVFSHYNDYVLSSACTGDSITFNAYDIYESDTLHPAFITYADLSSQGKPYARPHSYEGDTQLIYLATVQGANWLNIPLRFTGSEGYAFTQARNELSVSKSTADREFNMANGVLGGAFGKFQNNINPISQRLRSGTIGQMRRSNLAHQQSMWDQGLQSIGGGLPLLSGIASTAVNESNYDYQAKMSAIDYMEKVIESPNIMFAQQPNLQQFFGNCFVVSQVAQSPESARLDDKLFNMYGEEIQPIKTKMRHFNSRMYFNYVKTSGIRLKTNQARYINQIAEQQLDGGVRIWHTAPNPHYYEIDNPVKGVTA